MVDEPGDRGTMMRAAMVRRFGGSETIQVEEVPAPVAGAGEVVVAVEAASVNFPDVLLVADRYQMHASLPFTPGSELAGTVVAQGPGVEVPALGARVAGAVATGAFAEQCVVAAGTLTPVPPTVSAEDAAAFGVAYRTAYHALRTMAAVRAGESVAVLGASGGVGTAALGIAHLLGARPIAVSQGAKLDACLAAGAVATIDYDREDLKVRLREVAGGPVDVVVDMVGGAYSEPALRACGWGSRFVTVGFASGEIPRIPLNLVLLKGVVIMGFEMRGVMASRPEDMVKGDAELWEWQATGRLRPTIGATFALDDVVSAMRMVEERAQVGKIVIRP